MNAGDIKLIYDYNYWARDRILSAAARVSDDQYAAPAGYPYGGLRGTLVHMLDAEQSWRHIMALGYWTPELLETDFPTLQVLQEAWAVEEAAMRSFLAGLSDEALTGIVRYTADTGHERKRVLWHCLIHLANHGTQHRAEAAAMLTGYGQSPGDLDFTLFLNERGPTAA